MNNSSISRDEIRSVIEDKLCAIFSVTSETATDEQVFQAAAIVIREIMGRFLAVENPNKHNKEIHYMSMEFLMGRSLMKNAYNLGISEALIGALEDLGRNATDIFEAEPDIWKACQLSGSAARGIPSVMNWVSSARSLRTASRRRLPITGVPQWKAG